MVKPKGRHPSNRLTAVGIKAIKTPGRYADGAGLYLVADENLNKRWVLRLVVPSTGKRTDLGLGSLSTVSLAEAREMATRWRKVAKEGRDPKAEKRARTKVIPTFAEAARKVHAEHKSSWRNPKHQVQWLSSLEQHAFPVLGEVRVDRIDSPKILEALAPIWTTLPETGRRVRQRIGATLDWAAAAGFRTGENPVRGVTKGLPKQPKARGHFKAMPYADVPDFVQRIRAELPEATALALELLILTATRTNEIRYAQPDEFEGDVWTIPGSRMKAGVTHRIPLVPRCVEIVGRAKDLAPGAPYLFAGRSLKAPMSDMALAMALRRMDVAATVHGFRSAFSDWVSEETSIPHSLAEMALAHAIRDKVEAAYRRGDLFEKRRKLMEAWAGFCLGSSAGVVRMRRAKR